MREKDKKFKDREDDKGRGRGPITQPGPMPHPRPRPAANIVNPIRPKGLMETLGVQNGASLDAQLASMPKTSGPIASGGTGVGPVNTGGLGVGIMNNPSMGTPDDFISRNPRTPIGPGGISGALKQIASQAGPGMKKGGKVKAKPAKKMASGGKTSSASKRGDGCAIKGKTKGKMV